ncbi:hypothetical protein EG327_007008 [Venturia inaequalis]|nr:hypothetical protein EG327_007008 [Venturia inaequalis]
MPRSLYQQLSSPPSKKRALPSEDIDHESPSFESEPKKRKRAPAKPKATKKDEGTCSLSKKDFGDRIKETLKLEKYSLNRTRIDLTMDLPFFRSFFEKNPKLTNPLSITPSPDTISDDTPVVVMDITGTQAGEIFGVTKTKSGNRMETTQLGSMCLVFYPAKGRATVWTTVSTWRDAYALAL